MLSQWDKFLKNLGTWEGSFTSFSPEGVELQNIPSRLILEGLDNNNKVRLNLTRFLSNEEKKELNLEFSSLNKSILFFEDGAFSQGSIQWSPVSEFGAELGLIRGDRRLRLVQQYNSQSEFSNLTLIREKSPQSLTPERPPLTLDQLIGTWVGQVTSIYPDLRPPEQYQSHLEITRLSEHRLQQKLTFGTGNNQRQITSEATINGSRILFEQSPLPVQILMLPDGASCNCPLKILPQNPFVLELGWLLDPSTRHRIIRTYSPKGEWVNLSLVEEQKID